MRRCIIPLLVLFGPIHCWANTDYYRIEFTVFEDGDIVSTPSLLVEAGQAGHIRINEESRSKLSLEFIIEPREEGVILLDSRATYNGDTHDLDLLIRIDRVACFVIAEFDLTVNVRKISMSDT